MLNNFIYAQTKDLFLEHLGAGNVLDEAVVFIADTKEIWNHGTFFGRACDIDPELVTELEAAVASLEKDKANKSDLPDLSGYLTKTAAESLYATIATVNSELAKKQDIISDLDEIRAASANNIFNVVYEQTTYDELKAAYDAGKTCICRYNDRIYTLCQYSPISNAFYFIHLTYFAEGGEKGGVENWYISATKASTEPTGLLWRILWDEIERVVNRVDEISSSNMFNKYPSVEAVYNYAAAKTDLDTKQDVISDLATIRANAAKGATALQSVPTEYVTETELTNKGYSTTSYVDQKVADLVNGAPDTLNTLDELAAALKDNKDIVTVLENSIANKADKEHSHENYQEKGNYLTYVDKDGSKVVEPIAVNNILAVIDENSENVAALYCDSDGGAVLANRYCVGGFDRGYGMNTNNQPVWLYPETDGNIGGSEFSFEGHTHDEYITNDELQSALADVKVDVDLSEYAKLTDIPSHDNFVTKDTLPNSIIVPENLEIVASETEAGKVYFGYYNNPTTGSSNSGIFMNVDGAIVGPAPLDTNTMMEFEIVDGKVVEDDMDAILNVLFNVVADTTSAILTRVRIDEEYYYGISYITFFGRSAGSSMGHSFKFKSLGEGRTLEVSFESYGGNAASFQDTRSVSVKFTEPESIDLSEYAKLSDIPSHDNYLEVVDGAISVPAGIAVGSDENVAAMINMGDDGTAVIANKIVGSDFAFGLMYTDYRIRLNDNNRPILYWENEEGAPRTIPFSMEGHTHDEYAIASDVVTKDEFSTLQTGMSENELVVSAALADLNERFNELQGGSATQTQITELQQTIQTLQTEIANIKAELVKTLNVE